MAQSYVRIYADEAGESHFDEVSVEQQSVDYAPPAPALSASAPESAAKWLLLSGEAGWDGRWHPSPVRQFMIGLSGHFELEASDGERRMFGTGDVLLLEDMAGKGHYTRIPADSPATVFVVHL